MMKSFTFIFLHCFFLITTVPLFSTVTYPTRNLSASSIKRKKQPFQGHSYMSHLGLKNKKPDMPAKSNLQPQVVNYPREIAAHLHHTKGYPLHFVAHNTRDLVLLSMEDQEFFIDVRSIIKHLRKTYLCDIDELDDESHTPLDRALESGNYQLSAFFRSQGARQTFHINHCSTLYKVLSHLRLNPVDAREKKICVDLSLRPHAFQMPKAFSSLTSYNIVLLNASACNVGTNTLARFAQISSLKELWLAGNNFGKQPSILKSLTKLEHLEVIDLSYTNVTPDSLQPLIKCNNLKVLFLLGNPALTINDPLVTQLRTNGVRVWI